jgi:hypothetical protein
MPLRPPAGFISAFYDPLNNPNAPTIGTATGGDASASVAFTPPANVGGSAISLYGARSTPENITATAASSPISVTGLTNGTAYTFAVWATNTYGPSAFSGASNSVTPVAPPIGLFGGGNSGTRTNVINQIIITTTGNATDFGDLTVARTEPGACASSVRGVWAGGETNTHTNIIDYVTIASAGNATDFGDLLTTRYALSGCSNDTRGIFSGGYGASDVNNIEYITIASTGDATDFGDLLSTYYGTANCASPTRGIIAGGESNNASPPGASNVIQYITIASTGNALDFGDLAQTTGVTTGCSSATRGLILGGANSGAPVNVISYITIASLGNATDFGDLLAAQRDAAACSSSIRGVYGGGSGPSNVIQYVTIATTGNATDFGDLQAATSRLAACSNAHGGLS